VSSPLDRVTHRRTNGSVLCLKSRTPQLSIFVQRLCFPTPNIHHRIRNLQVGQSLDGHLAMLILNRTLTQPSTPNFRSRSRLPNHMKINFSRLSQTVFLMKKQHSSTSLCLLYIPVLLPILTNAVDCLISLLAFCSHI
jgi:hypothetical protein